MPLVMSLLVFVPHSPAFHGFPHVEFIRRQALVLSCWCPEEGRRGEGERTHSNIHHDAHLAWAQGAQTIYLRFSFPETAVLAEAAVSQKSVSLSRV